MTAALVFAFLAGAFLVTLSVVVAWIVTQIATERARAERHRRALLAPGSTSVETFKREIRVGEAPR
jgi:flagellar biogenesis protein FliO